MDAISLLNEQLRLAVEWSDRTMDEVTPEVAHWQPPGQANPIGANYAHAACREDVIVNALLRGVSPLFATTFAGKTGLSEPPPLGPAWHEWARRLRVDLPATREYAAAVHASARDYFDVLTPEALERTVDAPLAEGSPRTVAGLLSAMIGELLQHTGEISTLKRLQGLKGYPN